MKKGGIQQPTSPILTLHGNYDYEAIQDSHGHQRHYPREHQSAEIEIIA